MKKVKLKYTREFLGTLITADNYNTILKKEGKSGVVYHNKHLKAYTRGDKTFTHGYEVNSSGKIVGKKTHKVQEKINLVD